MTSEEFIAEMKRIEVCGRGQLDPDKILARRDVLWERLADAPVSVLRAARNILLDSGLEYIPTVPEILEACREAEQSNRRNSTILRVRYQPHKHTCAAEKPTCNTALTELQWAFPYEAVHIVCPGNIPATCPSCGKRRMEQGVFSEIMARYPQETTNWNPCYKGLMVCGPCSKGGAR